MIDSLKINMDPINPTDILRRYKEKIVLHDELWARLDDSFENLLKKIDLKDPPDFFNEVKRHFLGEHKTGLKIELEEAANNCALHYLKAHEYLSKGDDFKAINECLSMAEAYGRFSYFNYFLLLEAKTKVKRFTQAQNASKPFAEKMQAKICELLNSAPLSDFENITKASTFPAKALKSLEDALADFADNLKPEGGQEVRLKGLEMIRNWFRGNKRFQEKVQAIVASKIQPTNDHDF